MKPVSIKMSAFGPYKDCVFIDFTKFYDSGMFLITGDTGSGKTTIFDAMCFALFGSASGVNRDKTSFRSDFASDDIRTYVIFEFSHKECLYKIERWPSYVRKKKRGDGVTQVSGDASLTYLDKVVTGDKNVTDKCIEILGINYLQFKQISMIAQGEFLRLLLSKPSEKADIFRKIFDTGIYKGISDKLKEKYLRLKREYEDVLLNLNSLRDNVIWDKSLDDNLSIGDFLELLLDNITTLKKEDDKLSVNRTKILNKIQKNTIKINNASEINNNFDKYETLNREKKAKMMVDINDKRECISKNRDIYERIVPLYEEMLKCKNILEDKREEYLDNKIKLDLVNVSYNELMVEYSNKDEISGNLDDLKLKLNGLESKLPLFVEINNLELELDRLNNIYNLLKIRELNCLIDMIDANGVLNDRYSEEYNKFLSVKDRYNELNSEYSCLYNKFIDCQAGLLAADLVDGSACPVCGSLDHPCKASISQEIVTRDDLIELKNNIDSCQKELEILSSNVSSLKKELEISNKEISCLNKEKIKEEIIIYQEIVTRDDVVDDISIGDVEREISYVRASLDSKIKIVDKDDSKDNLLESIDILRNEIDKLNKQLEELNNRYERVINEKIELESVVKVLDKECLEYSQQLVVLEKEYEDMYKSLGYDSEEDYFLVKLSKDDYLKIQEELNIYDKEMIDLDGRIETIFEMIKGREKINVDNLLEDRNKLNRQLEENDLSLKDIHSRLSNNKMIYEKINSVYKKMKEIERKLGIYEDLSNTANGNIKGKNKLEFEQYVQAYYFDMVLESANKRFSYMTDSRYLLVRKVSSSKISDKLGLELEVIDNYTGKRRDVSSLSGGESFKAALSLSLGISDVIQSYAGGIVVEALFIDEGFGSLDSESLDQAMNAISVINTNNSLIGIISHINELKDRIDKKIIVKKSNYGSSVSLVV